MKKLGFLAVGLVLGFLVASGWAGSLVAKFGGVDVPPTITVMPVEDAPVVVSTVRPYSPAPTVTTVRPDAFEAREALGGTADGVKREGIEVLRETAGSSGGRNK